MTSFDITQALVVIGEGTADEVRIKADDAAVALIECDVHLTVGSHAQKVSLKAIDFVGAWRKATFGKTLKVYLADSLVFNGTITMPRRDVVGGAVQLELDAVGRSYVLYTKQIAADTTYTNQTTGTIAKDVVDDHFAGVLTSTNMTTATGVTLQEFTVSVGENVGAVLERLAKLDGYSFFVDASSDVHYYQVSGTSQLTVTEEDLVGDVGEHFVEEGVTPPRNIVRVKGGSGFQETYRYETQTTNFALNATTRRAGILFQALTSRLSSISLYLNATTGANIPGSLTVEIFPNRSNNTDITTLTSADNGAGTFELDATTKRVAIAFTTPSGLGPWPDQTFIYTSRTGTPGTLVAAVYTVDASNKPLAQVATGTTTFVSDAGNSRINCTFSPTSSVLTPGTKYAIVLTPTTGTWDASNKYTLRAATTPDALVAYWDSTDGGSTWNTNAGKFRVSFNFEGSRPTTTAESFSTASVANDAVYPPGSAGFAGTNGFTVTYATPKLSLTANEWYWIVLSDSAATASKYWSSYYDGGTTLDFGTSTDSGTTYTGVGKATVKLFFSGETVDVTETNAASIASYGEWYHEEVLPEITTNDDATAVANAILTAHSAPLSRMTLPLKKVVPSLTPKQKVTVVRPLLGINSTETVAEIRHEIRRSGARSVIITGAAPYNGARAVEELRKQV